MFSKNGRRAILAGFCIWLVSISCNLSAGGIVTPAVIDTPTPARIPDASPTPTLAASECPQPLDEETLGRLEFSLGALSLAHELPSGITYTFTLGTVDCCYFFVPVVACATWSVEPTSGASIDPQTGVFHVEPNVANGTTFTVHADVEAGRRVISQEVVVFTLAENPLVGYWQETAQLACEGGAEIIPNVLIGELQFRADGSFAVTWAPFEVYRDYWGTYLYNLESGSLELTIDGGNHVPENIDGSGQFRFDENGRLILDGLWLGEPAFEQLPVQCGHVFE